MGETAGTNKYRRKAIIVHTRDSKCPLRVNSKCPLCVDGVHLRIADWLCRVVGVVGAGVGTGVAVVGVVVGAAEIAENVEEATPAEEDTDAFHEGATLLEGGDPRG